MFMNGLQTVKPLNFKNYCRMYSDNGKFMGLGFGGSKVTTNLCWGRRD